MRLAVVVATALLCASASASEVFVTKDAQGRPVYTDRPVSLPAQKVNVTSKSTDVVEAQARYQQQMQAYSEQEAAAAEASKKAADSQQAAALTATDRAKRCQDARDYYQTVMNAQRLYQTGATSDERQYLTSAEIDDTRANAKRVMDEFCAGQ
jgi:hypothetical protein